MVSPLKITFKEISREHKWVHHLYFLLLGIFYRHNNLHDLGLENLFVIKKKKKKQSPDLKQRTALQFSLFKRSEVKNKTKHLLLLQEIHAFVCLRDKE